MMALGTEVKLEGGRRVNPSMDGGARDGREVALVVAASILEWKAEDREEMICSWKAKDG